MLWQPKKAQLHKKLYSGHLVSATFATQMMSLALALCVWILFVVSWASCGGGEWVRKANKDETTIPVVLRHPQKLNVPNVCDFYGCWWQILIGCFSSYIFASPSSLQGPVLQLFPFPLSVATITDPQQHLNQLFLGGKRKKSVNTKLQWRQWV